MSKLFLCFAFLATLLSANLLHAASFYDFKYTDTNKKEIKFTEFKGKTVMVVNIATRCGFTGQLDDLEKLYQTYKNKNFIIIAFPSNEFLSQAPESSEEIANICHLKYGVTFPVFEKQTIVGSDQNALYAWLTSQKGYDGFIGWNFVKFLVDKNGNVVGRFTSKTEPLDSSVTKAIEKIL
jgi:glutathione peroxidase